MKPNDPRLYWYLEKLEELHLNPEAKIIGLNKEEFLEHVDFLFGPIFDEEGNSLFIEDFRYLSFAIQKLLAIGNMEQYFNARNVPLQIIENAKELSDEMEPERERLEARNGIDQYIKNEKIRQERLRTQGMAQAEKEVTRTVREVVLKSLPPSLANESEVVEELSEKVSNEIVRGFLELAPREKLTPADCQRVILNLVETSDLFTQENLPHLPSETLVLLKQNLMAPPRLDHRTASVLGEISKNVSLPKKTITKIPRADTALSWVTTLTHPQDFFLKVVTAPMVKTAQLAARVGLIDEDEIRAEIKAEREKTRPDLKRILALERELMDNVHFKKRSGTFLSLAGATRGDLEGLLNFLEIQEGLGSTDPLVLELRGHLQYLDKFRETHPFLSRVAQLNFRLDRALGRGFQTEIGGSKAYLPRLEPATGLRKNINEFALNRLPQLYQQEILFPGVKAIKLLPKQKLAGVEIRFYKKAVRPVLVRLGRGAVGKTIRAGVRKVFAKGLKRAVKESIKKVGSWVAAKLGIQAGVTALAGALGVETLGVSVIIGALINLGIEAINKVFGPLLNKIWEKFKGLTGNWKTSAALVGVGVVTLIIGGPIIVAAPLIGLGVIGLAAGAAAGAGAFLGGTAAGITGFFSALGLAFVTTPAVAIFTVGTLGGLTVITFLIVITTAGAFITPEQPEEIVSAYIKLVKSVDHDQIENIKLPLTINYSVSVTAKQAPIIITSFYDQRIISCDPPGKIPADFENRINLPLPSGPITGDWSTSYSVDLTTNDYKDCLLCNTATVVANIEGGGSEIVSDGLCVTIGNPPEECPNIWPTDSGYITQGPNTPCSKQDKCTSHCNVEAIDIGFGNIMGIPVKSTHAGSVVRTGGGGTNKWVRVKGNCNGPFTTLYAHLQNIDPKIQVGKPVSRGQPIGTSGSDGTGPHLHYQFSGSIKMEFSYIPKPVPKGCCTPCGACHDEPCGVTLP